MACCCIIIFLFIAQKSRGWAIKVRKRNCRPWFLLFPPPFFFFFFFRAGMAEIYGLLPIVGARVVRWTRLCLYKRKTELVLLRHARPPPRKRKKKKVGTDLIRLSCSFLWAPLVNFSFNSRPSSTRLCPVSWLVQTYFSPLADRSAQILGNCRLFQKSKRGKCLKNTKQNTNWKTWALPTIFLWFSVVSSFSKCPVSLQTFEGARNFTPAASSPI